MSMGLHNGLTLSATQGLAAPAIALSATSILESAVSGSTVGVLSVVNHPSGSSGWTFAETADPDNKFTVSGSNLNTSASLNYEAATSHSVTITASKSGQTDIVRVFTITVTNVLEVTLGALALSSLSFSTASSSSGSITGKTSGSTVTLSGTLPTGLTLDLTAMTWAWAGGGSVSTGSFDLVETHPDASNSGRTSTQSWAIVAVSAAQLWSPANATAGTIKGWWNISDAATVSLTGTSVDSVTDKSGNGVALFGGIGNGSATKPTIHTTSFSQYAAIFDGSHNVLCSSSTMSQSQPFAVYQSIYPFLTGPSNQTGFDGGNTILFRPKQGSNPLVFAGSVDLTRPSMTGTPQVTRCVWSGGNGSLGINGGADSTKTAGSNNISSGAIRLGDSPTNDAPFYGIIRETVMTTGDVTSGSDLDLRLTGYLAWEGGTWQYLVSGHTYEFKAPKVGMTPATPTVPSQSTAFIPHGTSSTDYHYANIFDPCIVDHPTDSTKLVLYASGQGIDDGIGGNPSPGNGVARIGRWIIDKANPTTTPTFDQVVLTTGMGPAWNNQAGGVRLGSVLYVGGTYYMYFCTQLTGTAIGVATSTDGVTFTINSSTMLVPSGDETQIGEPAVWWEGGVATMIYTYRTASAVLPGYRYATASSLTGPFTKGTGPDILYRPITPNNNASYIEAHQILKRNGRYYLLCEVGASTSDATPYRIYLASADAVTGPYKWEKLVLKENSALAGSSGGVGGGEKYHVATPGLFTINGTDYLFRTGAPDKAQPYGENHWNMYVSTATGIFDEAP